MGVHVSVCLFVCFIVCVCVFVGLIVCLSVCWFVSLSVCLPVSWSVSWFVCLSLGMSSRLYLGLSTCLPLRLTVCMSVCLLVCLYVCLSDSWLSGLKSWITFDGMKESWQFSGTFQLCRSNFWAGVSDQLASRVGPWAKNGLFLVNLSPPWVFILLGCDVPFVNLRTVAKKVIQCLCLSLYGWEGMCLSLCLFVLLPFCLCVCLFYCLFVCVYLGLSLGLSVCLFVCLFVRLFVRLLVSLSLGLSVCLSFWLLVCLSGLTLDGKKESWQFSGTFQGCNNFGNIPTLQK